MPCLPLHTGKRRKNKPKKTIELCSKRPCLPLYSPKLGRSLLPLLPNELCFLPPLLCSPLQVMVIQSFFFPCSGAMTCRPLPSSAVHRFPSPSLMLPFTYDDHSADAHASTSVPSNTHCCVTLIIDCHRIRIINSPLLDSYELLSLFPHPLESLASASIHSSCRDGRAHCPVPRLVHHSLQCLPGVLQIRMTLHAANRLR